MVPLARRWIPRVATNVMTQPHMSTVVLDWFEELKARVPVD